MSSFIVADAIHAHYGQSHILQGVSLQIDAGEAIGLLGRNGMGKSTLIRTIMGHVPASGGTITVRGKNCTRAAPYRSEEHTSELQSLMRISYAVFCLKKKT